MAKDFLPYYWISIGKEEIDAVVSTLKSEWLTMGKKVMRFEELVAKETKAKHAVALNSCTEALELSLSVLGVGHGDEVITTPYTFAATGNVIVHTGAKPVFVDIRRDSYNIDPSKIEKAITKKTKAIMPVDFAGQIYDVKEINEIAKKHDLAIIEDAAHAIGCKYGGKQTGTFSTTTCFSFYTTKNITSVEGGMITTEDDAIAEKCRSLRLHGLSAGAWARYAKKGRPHYQSELFGWNYAMTDVLASIGVAQFPKLKRFLKRRREIGVRYNEELSKIDGLITPQDAPHQKHPFHLYPLLLKSYDRDKFIDEMRRHGIGTGVHFKPLHISPSYMRLFGFKRGDFPIAEWVYDREVSLPLYPKMTDGEVERVISTVKKIMASR